MAIVRTTKPRHCRKKPTALKFVKFLGKGSFGSVELFSYTKDDGSSFYKAVKMSFDHETISREFRILSELRGCPRIVQLSEDCLGLKEGIDLYGNKVYKMAMEYASAGTLTSFRLTGKIPDCLIKNFTRMILQGLVSLHSLGYVHCDLKPDNLLLFPVYDEEKCSLSYQVKISDFGLALKAGEEESVRWDYDHPFVGTPIYMSPESVEDGTVVKALDLWSLGCVVLEMYTGERPWLRVDNLNDLQVLLADDKKAPKVPYTVPSDARQFLDKCFALKPEDRGTASELLLHPFLTGVDDKKMSDATGGGEKRQGSRKAPGKFEDTKLKTISSKLPLFKRVSNKPLKLEILPPKSNFVPAH